ncbi:hypothetical protein P2G75_05250 [Cronobacter malonaticus]|uniref:hypothetical protein n=1 Tax=Cronobacter malonaticus TaxID=413503 RepID=UPI002DB696FD|nr:hypothetical protein [Cronobacter malonaticus]MEB8678453.1 hypothetical protein [Cronobacter malonaticus]
MKLIDLLVQELPKRGGWPEGPSQYLNDFLKRNKLTFFVNHHYSYFEDWDGDQVTREQYEAALTAAQKPVWDGEGLPPVGCECEISFLDESYRKCKILFMSQRTVLVAYETSNEHEDNEDAFVPEDVQFRPIQCNREEVTTKLRTCLAGTGAGITEHAASCLYDAIAAGKIPHIRIE